MSSLVKRDIYMRLRHVGKSHVPFSYRSFSGGVYDLNSKHRNVSGKGLGLDIPMEREPLWQPSSLTTVEKNYYYLYKLMGVFGKKAQMGANSEDLYRSIEEQATQPVFWKTLELPDDWATEHSMIALHVWILHNRFKVDYNLPGEFCGRRAQEELFARFWEDTGLRLRQAGIAEMTVNRNLETVQKMTFAQFFAYDNAIRAEDDGTAMMDALCDAFWKGDHSVPSEVILLLANYVEIEVQRILAQPAEDVYRGWVKWSPALGETEEDRVKRLRLLHEGEWREAIDPAGRLYFYHTTSLETRWDIPEDGLYSRRRFALRKYLDEFPEQKAKLIASEERLKNLQ